MRAVLLSSFRFAAVGALFVVLAPSTASAHHPEITAQAVCDDSGSVAIEYTSMAWLGATEASRQNDQIDILIDGIVVDSGAYNAPDFAFSGSVGTPGAATGDEFVVSAVAVSDWGNGHNGGQSRSTTVVVPELDCDPGVLNGRFTGGGGQIRVDGVRVTRGLTIHCDLLLSNNLQVNWTGNRFHTTEHLETVECSDDPNIGQAPPPAPLDTLIGVGTGRYNGEDGFTIEFTLVDAGEPGREDQAAIKIYETADDSNVVLDIPLQLLDHGNLQAHYDQPHK